MKKLAIILGVFFALLLATIVILPLVVDVDKYRPQIVDAANSQINGKLELGKLTLSLWGKILIRVDGVKLYDAQKNQLISVDNAYVHLPFSSVLSGSPALNFKMEKPQIVVVKNKAGQLNLMTLVKTTPAPKVAPPAAESPKNQPSQAPSEKTATAPVQSSSEPSTAAKAVALPALVTRARLGIELRDALLSYTDQATALKSETKNLNLIIKDLSLGRPMELELWADLDTVMAKVFSVKGPARVKARVAPEFSGAEFKEAKVTMQVDLDDLQISASNAFFKSKGVPANADVALTATQQAVKIEKFKLKFHNAEIAMTADLTQQPTPKVLANIESNEIELGPWVQLIPMMKDYELGGSVKLKANANGPTEKLAYAAQMDLKKITAKAPMLKSKPEINGSIKIITDQVQDLLITMKAPGNDVKLTGKVVSFTAPQVTLNLTSPGLDIDQLVDFPPPAKKTSGISPSPEWITTAHAEPEAAPPANYDLLLEPMRKNPALRALVANIGIDIASMKAKGVVMKAITSKITFKNLVATIEKFDLSVFSGKVAMKASTDLKPTAPTYSLDASIAALDLKQAVTSQMEMFKNTVYGKLSMSAKGTGASFNPTPAKEKLNLKGNLKVTEAVFASLDIGKMVNESIGGALAKVGDKIPGLKGKSLGKLPEKESKYESITSDFSIAGGQFNAPNFYAKAEKNSGVDLKGATSFGLITQAIHARWEVIDTYNLTRARDISVDISGTKVDHILAKGNDPVSFPITVKGTLSQPDYSYAEVAEHFANIALGNVGGAAKQRAQQEVQKRLIENAPAPAKKLLEGLGKKFFR